MWSYFPKNGYKMYAVNFTQFSWGVYTINWYFPRFSLLYPQILRIFVLGIFHAQNKKVVIFSNVRIVFLLSWKVGFGLYANCGCAIWTTKRNKWVHIVVYIAHPLLFRRTQVDYSYDSQISQYTYFPNNSSSSKMQGSTLKGGVTSLKLRIFPEFQELLCFHNMFLQ